MKYLVVGLGNPGVEYAHTRHNIGFDVLDELAAAAGSSFSSERLAHVARIKIRGRQVILVKPNTYMNLSGKAVNYWLQAEHISRENLLVITDDIALPVGAVRIRLRGSDGGHNGLKDIQEVLNSTDYARLRFGVGNDFPKGKQADFVLSGWADEEKKLVEERIKLAADAIRTFVAAGASMAMNQFNNK